MNKNANGVLVTLPPVPISDMEFAEELRKAEKGISVRLEPDQARVIAYLDVACSMPKAAVIKRCIDFALPHIYGSVRNNLAALEPTIGGTNSAQIEQDRREAGQADSLLSLAKSHSKISSKPRRARRSR